MTNSNVVDSLTPLAQAAELFEFANEDILSVEVAFRRKSDNVFVMAHYDGEKFVKSNQEDRFRYQKINPQATPERICLDLGIALYPVAGHCHEAEMVADEGEEIRDKWFVTFEVGSVSDRCLNNDPDAKHLTSAFVSGADVPSWYRKLYQYMLSKEYI